MWISKKKWQELEKRVADLEGQVQGQPEEKLKTGLTPPMNCIFSSGRYAPLDRECSSRDAIIYGGGGIDYDGLTIEALRDINKSISVIGSLIKDILISPEIKHE